MAQVQCPNCGGYKTQTERTRQVDQLTGDKPRGVSIPRFIVGTIISAVILIGLLKLFPPSDGTGITIELVIAIVGGYVLGGVGANAVKMQESRNRAVTIYDFSCQLCGYRWEWREGTPLPNVTVRPDLIQQGEQRLQEEARRNQEQMQAAWWAEQQRKK